MATLAYLLVFIAAAIYIARAYRSWRLRQEVKRALDVESLPEARWANIIKKGKEDLPPEQHEQFEAAIFRLVHDLNTVNSMGLKTERDRLNALSELTKAKGNAGQQGIPADGSRPAGGPRR
jgi:hypothetical protein